AVLGVAATALESNDLRRLRPDACPRGRILESRQDGFAVAFQRPLGHQCRLDARARRGIRVLVDRRIDAACARIVDQPERLYALSPVAGSYDLVMRDLRRQPALLADPDRLPDAVEDARRLIAHVRDVDSTHRASDAGQLDDL